MRVRIRVRPSGSADGISLDRFEPGFIYDVGTSIGNLLLAERWAEPADDARPALVVPLADEGAPHAILVVDDDPQMRTMLTTLLTLEGYAVYTALNGRDGLMKVRQHRPTLILLDLKMPGMSGTEFRREQRRLQAPFADIPIVIVSGAEDAEREQERLSAVGYVPKPINDAALLAIIRAHCGSPNAAARRGTHG